MTRTSLCALVMVTAIAGCHHTTSPDAGVDAGRDAGPPPPPPPPGSFCSLPGSFVYGDQGNMSLIGTSPVDLSWLKVPPGFCVHWFGNVGNARQLRVAPGGELFVSSPTQGTTSGGPNGLAAIVVLPDDNADGYADLADGGSSAECAGDGGLTCCQYTTFLGGNGSDVWPCNNSPTHPLGSLSDTQGLMFTPGWIYYQDFNCIRRLPYSTRQRVSMGDPSASGSSMCGGFGQNDQYLSPPNRDASAYGNTVIDVTTYVSGGHWPKAIDVAKDGTIYVTNGGDQGEECIEPNLDAADMPYHGGIWEVNGTSGGEPIVKGLRNPIGLRCETDFDNCFAVELAQDYSWQTPGSEKLFLVHSGDNWGYPCCADKGLPYVVDRQQDGGVVSVVAYGAGPDGGDNMPEGTPGCSGVAQTTNGFEIAETPFGLDFAPADWPASLGGSVIVVLHGAFGSWIGARVVTIQTDPTTGIPLPSSDLDGGAPAAQADFATGWDDQGLKAHGRPSAIAVAADGRAFISNDQNGDIVWIAPVGMLMPDAGAPDAGRSDAGATDAGVSDAGASDGGVDGGSADAGDAGPTDAGAP